MTSRQDLAIPDQTANPLQRSGLPLYLQLERILREKINSGRFNPGDTFPTEAQISGEFGVSRITVREALRGLTKEGLLVRRSGKRTMVLKKPSFGAHLAAFEFKDLIYGGYEAGTRRDVISLRVIPTNSPVAEALQIPSKTKVLELRCVIYSGDTPTAYLTATTPFKYGKDIPKKRFSEAPMILLLTEICKLQVGELDQWTTGGQAEGHVASELGIKVGTPLVIVRRVFSDYERAPIELSIVQYPADRFRHHLNLRGEHLRPSESKHIA